MCQNYLSLRIKTKVTNDYSYISKDIDNDNSVRTIPSYTAESLFSLISSPNFGLAVTMGLIPGMTWIDKFGKNDDIDTGSTPETVSQIGGLYEFGNDTGDDLYISSSDVLDTQEISLLIYQNDANGNWNWSTVRATLQGQTPVLVASDVTRCHRMENEADFPNNIQGNVYAYYDNTDVSNGVPNDVTNILSEIVNGSNQSKQMTFTIPTGYVGFLFRGESGVTKAVSTAEADFAYRSRRYGKVFKEKKDYGCMTTGNNNYLDVRIFKDPIPAKTDFDITVTNVSANNMSAWATVDLLLVEEELINDNWLTILGQIKRVE